MTTYSYLIKRNPEAIEGVKNSSEVLSWMWAKAILDKVDTKEYLSKNIIADGLGIQDVTEDEFDKLWSWKSSGNPIEFFATALSDLVSKRAQIGVSCEYFA